MIEVKIAEALKARERTLYWLAKRTGMSYQAMSNLCKSATQRINFDTLNLICRELECQPGDILSYVADERPESEKKIMEKNREKKQHPLGGSKRKGS